MIWLLLIPWLLCCILATKAYHDKDWLGLVWFAVSGVMFFAVFSLLVTNRIIPS